MKNGRKMSFKILAAMLVISFILVPLSVGAKQDDSSKNNINGNSGQPEKVQESVTSQVYKTDRYIVKYRDKGLEGRNKSVLGEKAKSLNVKDIRGLKSSDRKMEVIITQDKITKDELLNRIKQQGRESEIEYIQPDYQLELSATDPYLNYQWGIYNPYELTTTTYLESVGQAVYNEVYREISYHVDADVKPAWDISLGEGITIALIDTGIDTTHQELSESIWINTSEIPDNGIDDDNNGYIDDVNGWNFYDNTNQISVSESVYQEWHGTHIAGIIAAEKDNGKGIAGVASKANIMSLKVFENNTAYTSDVIEAIAYAQEMGAQIVNCSFGSTDDNPALKEAVEQSNMLFIAAAGNSHTDIDSTPVYPASYNSPNVIAVASINKTGNLSWYSNYGRASVQTAAPGEYILSTIPRGLYGYSSGTSMAAAFVSGEAALLMSQDSGMLPAEVKEQIIFSSHRLSSLLDSVYRGGKISCSNAVNNQNLNTYEIISIPEDTSVTQSVYEEVYGTLGDFVLFSIDQGSIDINTLNLMEQAETLKILLSQVRVIRQLIEATKVWMNADENTEELIHQDEVLKMIITETKALNKLFERGKTQAQIQANLRALKQHSLTLNMLLRELKAMNHMVIVEPGSIEVNCTEGKVFNLIFTGKNLSQGSGDITYTVEYNTGQIQAIDLCSLTENPNISAANIPEAGITIDEFNYNEGIIKFTVSKEIASGKAWIGVLNSIKFKADETVTTQIQIKREQIRGIN